MTLIQIASLVAIAIIFVLGYGCGYEQGVEDTEQRWSDAVSRDEYYKNYRS
jgi:hypothetical protein